MSLRLLANVGAEEPLPASPPPAVACVAELFALLFPADTPALDGNPARSPWPEALGAPPARPAFRWLEAERGVFAWLNTEAAERAAAEAGLPLLGAPAETVRRVHDKAFAVRTREAEGLEAHSLRGLVQVFDAEALRDEAALLAEVRTRVGDWPDWTGRRFTMKPRFGGSGRGRVAGDPGDLEPLRRALPRLARQGGAVLEPWLTRETDLSAQLHLAEDGTLTLLATLEQRVSSSGVYRGHRGRLDHRLRITSGSRYDGELLEAASTLARAAHAAGFHGPCGVDAFTFVSDRGVELRPAVEWNARFTMGTLLAGLVRRATRVIEARVPASPGETRRLEFALDAPDAGWPADSEAHSWRIPLAPPGAFAPALRIAREPEPD